AQPRAAQGRFGGRRVLGRFRPARAEAVRRKPAPDRGLVRAGQAAPARLGKVSAGESGRSIEAHGRAQSEGESRSYGVVPSPLPRGRCMSTVSTHRPNLKPTERSVPTRRKPTEACRLMDGACALSPITAISWR